jgi:hypothetical protein
MYSRTPLLRLRLVDEPSGYAEIWKIGFFFENMLHWQFEVANVSTDDCFRLHIYLRSNKTLIHNSLQFLTNGEN